MVKGLVINLDQLKIVVHVHAATYQVWALGLRVEG